MKIQKFGSATILVETSDIKILCDPWLVDGAYFGSWYNFPPIDIKECDFSDVDFIYISHIHPDHFDPKTMDLLDKSTPVLIHKFHQNFLKLRIEHLGFKVVELENGLPTILSNSTKLSIYAADDCDPTICGRMFGCITGLIRGSMQLDSLCVIDDGSHILVNTNDCNFGIAKKTLARIKKSYPKIDFALVGYTSASLYPHSVLNFTDEEMELGRKRARDSGLSSGLNILKMLMPESYLPFAGTYILGGANHFKNKNLSMPEIQDAVGFFQKELSKDSINLNPVMLNFGQFFDTETNSQSAQYKPVDLEEKKLYIKDVVSKYAYEFESDEMPSNNEIIELFTQALIKFEQKRNEINFFEDTNLIFDIPKNLYVCINIKNIGISIVENLNEISHYHRFQLDPRLLKWVLKGPRYASWDNIEIGALLNFERKPDVYRIDIHTLLNSLRA
jgi:UDP-MurNAc hydroxylase